tara:strand:+ start:138 stop:536 length:399 start_codon:yes stop_codon:yes gene_type:complete
MADEPSIGLLVARAEAQRDWLQGLLVWLCDSVGRPSDTNLYSEGEPNYNLIVYTATGPLAELQDRLTTANQAIDDLLQEVATQKQLNNPVEQPTWDIEEEFHDILLRAVQDSSGSDTEPVSISMTPLGFSFN